MLTTTTENDRRTESVIGSFLKSVGYPEQVPSGAGGASVLSVDGMDVRVEVLEDRIVLSYLLSDDEALLPVLAEYAAGRMLKEDAVLSWEDGALLWQDASVNSGGSGFRRLFESFLDSCDWWRTRVDARAGEEGASPFPEVMIRP